MHYRPLATVFILALLGVACAQEPADDGGNDQAQSESSASADELVRLDLGLTWRHKGEFAPLFVALDNGYYEEEGLDVELSQGVGTSTTVQLVGLGTHQVGYGTTATAVQGIAAEDMPVTIVSLYEQTLPLAIVSHPEDPIETPSDLEGATLGLATGSAVNEQLEPFCRITDIDCSAIEVNQLDRAARTAAFFDQSIQGTEAFLSNEVPIWEHEQGKDFVTLPFADYDFPMPGAGIFVNDEFKDAQGDEVLPGLLRAIARGFEFAHENPEETAEMYVDNYWEGAPATEVVVRQIELATESVMSAAGDPLGNVDEAYWQDALDIMHESDQIPDPLTPSDIWDDSYVTSSE